MGKKNLIFIGIIEERPYTIDILKEMLKTFDYELIYSNTKNNVVFLYKENTIMIMISMKVRELEIFINYDIDFKFLIVNIVNPNFSEDIFQYQFTHCDYYIVNSDRYILNNLSLDTLEGIFITYGFNKKATMTISSYVIEQIIEANLCLQRYIVSMPGDRIVPFEFIIAINSRNKDYIYSIMAASILVIILGEKIQYKSSLRI